MQSRQPRVSDSTVEMVGEALSEALRTDRQAAREDARDMEDRRRLREIARAEEERDRAAERLHSDRVKYIASVVSAAPKYDGKGVFDFWRTAILQHLQLFEVPEAQHFQVARLCL